MSDNALVLGQGSSAIALDELFQALVSTVVSSITICNTGDESDATFSLLAVRSGEAVPIDYQYLYFNQNIPPHETFICTIGITLDKNDHIYYNSNSNFLALNAFGIQVTEAIKVPKILSQDIPVATVVDDLYATSLHAIITSLVICNIGNQNSKIRVTIRLSGTGTELQQQNIYNDLIIPAGETFIATVGITMSPTDIITCYSDTGSVAFNLFGFEIL